MKTHSRHKTPETGPQRIAIHFRCLCAHGRFRWHLRGMLREIPGLLKGFAIAHLG